MVSGGGDGYERGGLMSTAAPVSRFLEVDALSRLGNLRLSFRRVVEGPYAGRHESVERGGAVEFVDFRPYTPGEDLRRLDWKVLARMRKPYVRVFADESNLVCTLVLDASSSMLFEGHTRRGLSKLDYARYLSGAISFLVSRERDQVGLAVCADGLKEYRPPGSTATHISRICQTLESVKAIPATRLSVALRDLFPMVRRRSLVIVMSDFLVENLEEMFTTLGLYRQTHCEVVLMHIVHPEEETLPKGPAYRFDDLEEALEVSCSPVEVVRAYEDAFRGHVRKVSSLATAGGFEYRFVSTAVPYVLALKDMLVERRG